MARHTSNFLAVEQRAASAQTRTPRVSAAAPEGGRQSQANSLEVRLIRQGSADRWRRAIEADDHQRLTGWEGTQILLDDGPVLSADEK